MKFQAGEHVQVRMDNKWIDAVVNWEIRKGNTLACDVDFDAPFIDSEGYTIEGTIAYYSTSPTNEIRKVD